ncbi:vWA domain-containing protein [Chryseolinea lacunae]|uniref:VWA domain-containing protein n=1 Tax=Chryseolinea lacunae TaxID=2801331 RepID=A0ABS1KT88_9BACT|nr:VWA domain-containing protein [Chryseolinea lacunae]MBL0742579.1 VWA domain-containing protein [Chryseolinea lacunae]
MRHPLALLLLIVCLPWGANRATGQPLSQIQQKALNAYVDYANQSAEEVTAVVKSLMNYYPDLHRTKRYTNPRYVCPVQLEDYYLNTALAQAKALPPSHAQAIAAKLTALRTAAEKIDEQCKALDTYHKLEDYKQDNFAKADQIIVAVQELVGDYAQKQQDLATALETAFKKMNPYVATNAYHKTDAMMRQEIVREKAFLDAWTFNLNESVHTGWPVDKLEKSIVETDAQLKAFAAYKPFLKYPASSMYPSFQEAMGNMLEVKRNGLDGYNFDAKKSDTHSNQVYLDLINYYNGVLVSDYNTYVDFAQGNYSGLKTIKYVVRFGIRLEPKSDGVSVKPFNDIKHAAVAPLKQKTAISKTAFDALNNYIDFINEGERQLRYLHDVWRNANSDAAYYETIETFTGRGGMTFDYKNFEVPLSLFQKTVSDSEALPSTLARSLNDQAEVLLSILKEMDQQSASLQVEVTEKRYEQDHLKNVFAILDRNKVLYDVFDAKKEQLYNDVRTVYEAYPPVNAASSWYVSGSALQTLVDYDHEELFKARARYRGDTSVQISTAKIDQQLREVLAKEYANMKGIEKIGRNNGNCPYTPYEDLPKSSKALSERLAKFKPVTSDRNSEHPYHEMVYHYNDVVDYLNKFATLSKEVLLLKTVKQPEFFDVKHSEKKATPNTPKTDTPVAKPANQGGAATVPVTSPAVATQASPPPQRPATKPAAQTKVLHDTVYIEKRDTVYLGAPGENLRSMEGYASNNMVLLLDVSGSMNSPEKLPLLKTSVLNLLSMMRQEDEVSIIAFSGKPKVLLEGASFKEGEKIEKAIQDLKSSGKTDGNAGVKLAYKVADANYIRGGNNRIILATDGEFALSEEIQQLIDKFSREDIFLSVFNFGKGMGTSKSLEKLAGMGKGNYEYISKENVDYKLIREAKAKRKK